MEDTPKCREPNATANESAEITPTGTAPVSVGPAFPLCCCCCSVVVVVAVVLLFCSCSGC